MDIASLDKLDEYNRINNLTKYLDNSLNIDEDDNEDEENSYPSYLFENNQSNLNEITNTNVNHDQSSIINQEIFLQYDDNKVNITTEDFKIHHDEQFLGYQTNIEREESKIITQLTHSLHNKNVDFTSLQLQLNHTKLQLQAILLNEKKLQSECAHLQHKLAVTEQDKLLIEMHMKGIAQFEGSRHPIDPTLSVEAIRGKLLHVANQKISDLTNELSFAHEHIEEFEKQYGALDLNATSGVSHRELCSENESLRQELNHLSSQLAQRTVLYAAQQRKFQDNTRYIQSHLHEQQVENIQLKAMLKQVTGQFESTDKEKVSLILQNKQLESVKESLEKQVQDMQERLYALNNDLAEASSQNLVLQSTIDQLRTSDLEDLELNFSKELNSLRRESKIREDSLKKQLEEARAFVSQEAIHREEMLDEIENLRSELQSRSELLEQINNSGMSFWQSSDSRLFDISGNQRDTSSVIEANDSNAFYSVLQGDNSAIDDENSINQLDASRSHIHHHTESEREQESDSAWSVAAHLLIDQTSINPHPTQNDFEKLCASTSGSSNDRYNKQRTTVSDSMESQNSTNSAWYLHDIAKESTSLIGATQPSSNQLVTTTVTANKSHTTNNSEQQDNLSALNGFIEAMNEGIYSAILANAPLQSNQVENYNDSFNGKVLNKLLQTYYSTTNTNDDVADDHDKWFSSTLSTTAILHRNETNEIMTHVSILKSSLGLLVKRIVHYVHKQLMQRSDEDAISDDIEEEVIILRQNESILQEELAKLKSLLALVLRKASALDYSHSQAGPAVSTPGIPVDEEAAEKTKIIENKIVIELQQTIQELQSEKDYSIQQIETYRDEVKYLEDLAERNLELGRHEASNIYEYRLKQLESELNELKLQQEEAAAAEQERLKLISSTVLNTERESVVLNTIEVQSTTQLMELKDRSNSSTSTSHSMLVVNKEGDIRKENEFISVGEIPNNNKLLLAYKQYCVNLNKEIQTYELKLDRFRTMFKALKLECDTKIFLISEENKLKSYEVNELTTIISDLKKISIDTKHINEKLILEINHLKTSKESKIKEFKTKMIDYEDMINTLKQEIQQNKLEKEDLMNNMSEFKQQRLLDRTIGSISSDIIPHTDAVSTNISLLDASYVKQRDAVSTNISVLDASYVKQREFQDTVSSLQLQMEAFKHLNNLVMETLQGKQKFDDTQAVVSSVSASEIREMQLRIELDRKIEYVNDKIFHLLEQSSIHAQSTLLPLQQFATPATHLPTNILTPSPTSILSATTANMKGKEDDNQHIRDNTGLVIDMNKQSVLDHTTTAMADRSEEEKKYLLRIAELESANSHLIEHNMELVRSSLDENKLFRSHRINSDTKQDFSNEEKQQQHYSEESKISPTIKTGQHVMFLESQIQHYEVVVADLQKQLVEQKNKLVAKYRSRLNKQQELFEEEKMEMVKLVRQECAQIVTETYSLLQQSQMIKQTTPSSNANNRSNTMISSNGEGIDRNSNHISSVPITSNPNTYTNNPIITRADHNLNEQPSSNQPVTLSGKSVLPIRTSSLSAPKISHTTPTVTQRPRQQMNMSSTPTQVTAGIASSSTMTSKIDKHKMNASIPSSEQQSNASASGIANLVERGSARIFSSQSTSTSTLATSNRNSMKDNHQLLSSSSFKKKINNNSKAFTRTKHQPQGGGSRVLYPEMISPELTLELVHSIVGRSLIHEDYQDFQDEQLKQLRSSI